jgi:hypothetical protein
VREHRVAVDLEAFAELHIGACNDLLELGLALRQRQLPEVATVKVQQIKGDQDDLRRLPLELVLQYGEIGGAVGGRYHDLTVDHRRRGLDVPGIKGDLLEAMRPVVAAPGETLTASFARWIWTR